MVVVCFFFFNDTATTEIYTLSLHDALPISYSNTTSPKPAWPSASRIRVTRSEEHTSELQSRGLISHAVFCLKKTDTSPSRAYRSSEDARVRTAPRSYRN